MTTIGDGMPLAGIRVVDAVGGHLAPLTRHLAELGASVDRFIEHEVLDPADAMAANIGKTMHSSAIGSADAVKAIEAADIIVADAGQDIDLAQLRRARPGLVTMTTSDFGCGNSLSQWSGSNAILHALSGELARSGIRGRAPLVPPGDLAYQCAAVQGAFAVISALYRALRGGGGAHFDFSALDGAVQALDPGFGISGSATLGKPVGLLSRDRPREGFQYPIFPCADGYVRICLLSKRQWRGMFAWLGEPEQFASPEFDKTINRYKSPDLIPFIGRFFAGRNRAELEEEGQSFGVPISAINTIQEFMDTEHVASRDAIVATAEGIKVPNGALTIDGVRMGPIRQADAAASFPTPCLNESDGSSHPFAGLKVLDLGIIVVGAEQGRLLADLGADVIKIESRNFPDGNRQSYLSHGMSVSFAAGHRNKRSLGIDLRSPGGRELFLDLVRKADVVCSNFKPGTMAKLGLDEDVLMSANPRLVISESSAFGSTGPWSDRMGYGPLVRAATGLTLSWCYPDDPAGFSDSITIYPDHVAGRVCAIGVVALLIRRLRTGRGGHSAVAQSEVMLSHFGAEVIRVSQGMAPEAKPRRWTGIYPARGDDEWCAVEIVNEGQLERLEATIGANSKSPVSKLKQWCVARDPHEAASTLQSVGVPAAPMLRLADLPDFNYYRERAFYRVEQHPWLQEDVIGDSYVAKTDDLPPPPLRPAPLAGEDTRQIISDWTDLDSKQVEDLCHEGILEPLLKTTQAAAETFMASSQ